MLLVPFLVYPFSLYGTVNRIRKSFNVTLGTGLVYLYPPKHHTRATRILDEVISVDSNCVSALMARGSILQVAKKWDDAVGIYTKVIGLTVDKESTKSVAEEEHAWCLIHIGDMDTAAGELQHVLDIAEESDESDLRKAKILWKLGQCHWKMGGD